MVVAHQLLEMSSEDTGAPKSVFWAVDPRLPRIAAHAAVEFDWLLQNVPGSTRESIQKLWSLLGGTTTGTAHGEGSKALNESDSMGISLLAKAYNLAHQQSPVNTREDLDQAIAGLAADLEKARNGQDIRREQLEALRDFCVALSESAALYRSMIYGRRQEHPFRK